MKKILCYIIAFLINVHSVYASEWVSCMYTETVSLYKLE